MSKSNRKIAIVYQVVQHYREPVFTELLSRTGEYEFYVISGTNDRDDSVRQSQLSTSKFGTERVDTTSITNIWIGKHFLWQPGIIKLSRSQRFDAIIYLGNMYYLSTWVAAAVARLRGKKVLMWTHGVRRREKGLKGAARIVFYRLAHKLLLYGHNARKLLSEMGYPSDRMNVIYNSLDYTNMLAVLEKAQLRGRDELRAELGISTNEICLLMSGRLTESKKPSMLLYAAKRLREQGKAVKVVFVGNEESPGELRKLSAKLDVEKSCVFVGPCYDEERLAEYFHAADICVVPGDIGLAAIHSLTYGTPVLTHDDFDEQKPEYEAISPGVNGGFFKKNSVEDLCSKILAWTDKCSSLKQSEIAEACITPIAERYNPKMQAELIEEALSQSFE